MILFDNEAIQAIADPNHNKHRRLHAILTASSLERRRDVRQQSQRVVPTSVRVEAAWSRSRPTSAVLNAVAIRDASLDPVAADIAVELRHNLEGLTVADAHLGAVLEEGAVVVTSDPGDIARMAAYRKVSVRTIRI